MVRWLRWHCPPDTGFEIRALAVWGRARYLSVTEAPHNTNFHTWMGKKQFCFFQTAETGNRTRTLAWKAVVLTTTLGPPPYRDIVVLFMQQGIRLSYRHLKRLFKKIGLRQKRPESDMQSIITAMLDELAACSQCFGHRRMWSRLIHLIIYIFCTCEAKKVIELMWILDSEGAQRRKAH